MLQVVRRVDPGHDVVNNFCGAFFTHGRRQKRVEGFDERFRSIWAG